MSTASKFCARFPSNPSMLPEKTKLSSTRLLTFCCSTLEQMSKTVLYEPLSILSFIIVSRAFVPTFFIAFKPYEMVFSSIGLKSSNETFISGGRTSIPIFLHSLMRTTILSILAISLVKLALINSAG